MDDHLAFGEWFHGHTLDPTYMPEVIRVDSPVPMQWRRWANWQAGDPRWAFAVIDTDELIPEQVAEQVVEWAEATLAGLRPTLAGNWADQ